MNCKTINIKSIEFKRKHKYVEICMVSQYVSGFFFKLLKEMRRKTTLVTLDNDIKSCDYKILGQSPWIMAMCLVWQSVLLGNG